MQYKIVVNDSAYESWEIYNADTLEILGEDCKTFQPTLLKLFNTDIFEIEPAPKILHSCIRSATHIPGVLVLENNRTYGKNSNKLLYKCIPDDKRLPAFLIPYEIKKGQFIKKQLNRYVTFKYHSWDSKHPYGTTMQNIGDVSTLDTFYEYQLYCKSLNASIQDLTKATRDALRKKDHNQYIQSIIDHNKLDDRRNQYVFTVDSASTQDYDDAIGIKVIDDFTSVLSVYISNVTLWIEELGLWNSLSKRIATIYLPDRKRPMLPNVLSECLCSLQEKETRFAFTMDVTICNSHITNVEFVNSIVMIDKNYHYEESSLIACESYKRILKLIQCMQDKYQYVNNVQNSYDVVTYCMILMNYESAKRMNHHNNGIYRSAVCKSDTKIPEHLPREVYKFLNNWTNSSGQYVLNKTGAHDLLELECYLHITSPIRRLVDMLNIIQFQKNENIINVSPKADAFYSEWTNQMDYINTTMRAIRKVQTDCDLLHMCMKDPEVFNRDYNGYVFDKLVRNDKLFQYMVYLPDIKMVARITSRVEKDDYTSSKFRIYVFRDEARLKKKIRLQLLED